MEYPLGVLFDPIDDVPHLVRAQQFSRASLDALFERADVLRSTADAGSIVARRRLAERGRGHLMFNVFYQPSTRTRISFATAALRLGVGVTGTESAGEFSSAAKGETLEDSIRVLDEYGADLIVLRHPEAGAAERAAAVSSTPIVNAGDGVGQHPTQALTDLYTLRRELGRLDGLTVAVGGDLNHGRTVRSLSYLLGRYDDVSLVFCAPEEFRARPDILAYLDRHDVRWRETDSVIDAVSGADAVYWTRLQREYLDDVRRAEELMRAWTIGVDAVAAMPDHAVLLHPLPRVGEIETVVDSDPRAAYFRQAGNGMWVRTALVEDIIGLEI